MFVPMKPPFAVNKPALVMVPVPEVLMLPDVAMLPDQLMLPLVSAPVPVIAVATASLTSTRAASLPSKRLNSVASTDAPLIAKVVLLFPTTESVPVVFPKVVPCPAVTLMLPEVRPPLAVIKPALVIVPVPVVLMLPLVVIAPDQLIAPVVSVPVPVMAVF